MLDSFNEMVSESLDYYVYALSDPKKSSALHEKVFYIGKGQGNRCFNHAREERGKKDELLHEGEHKLAKIREIREKGLDVEILIIAHKLSEDEAFHMEAVLIPLIGEQNKKLGHGSEKFWLTKPQIQELYDKPVERKEIEELHCNVLIVSLNQQIEIDALQKNEDKMAKATLGEWNVSEKNSRQVDVIIGVKNSLVVSIYKVEKTNSGHASFDRISKKKKGAHDRSRFRGTRMWGLESKLKGRIILQGTVKLTKIRPGAGCQLLKN